MRRTHQDGCDNLERSLFPPSSPLFLSPSLPPSLSSSVGTIYIRLYNTEHIQRGDEDLSAVRGVSAVSAGTEEKANVSK